jgi:hypothetical protein
VTDPTTPIDGAPAPAVATELPVDETPAEASGSETTNVDDIDLDAIERDLDSVERALDQMADGTYFERDGSPAAGDPTR